MHRPPELTSRLRHVLIGGLVAAGVLLCASRLEGQSRFRGIAGPGRMSLGSTWSRTAHRGSSRFMAATPRSGLNRFGFGYGPGFGYGNFPSRYYGQWSSGHYTCGTSWYSWSGWPVWTWSPWYTGFWPRTVTVSSARFGPLFTAPVGYFSCGVPTPVPVCMTADYQAILHVYNVSPFAGSLVNATNPAVSPHATGPLDHNPVRERLDPRDLVALRPAESMYRVAAREHAETVSTNEVKAPATSVKTVTAVYLGIRMRGREFVPFSDHDPVALPLSDSGVSDEPSVRPPPLVIPDP